jgi:hypothetical protein
MKCCRYNALQHSVEVIDKEATHAKQLLEEGKGFRVLFLEV